MKYIFQSLHWLKNLSKENKTKNRESEFLSLFFAIMNIISVENIIATYFDQNPNKDIITGETIYKIQKLLEAEFKKEKMLVWIDYTRGTLSSILSNNNDLFEKEETKDETAIKLINRDKFNEEFKRYFDAKLEYEIKPIYLQLVELFKEPIE